MTGKQVYNGLPMVIKQVLNISNGWLVGSPIDNLSANKETKDFDIIVPTGGSLQKVVQFMGGQINSNTFGGLKFKKDNLVVDVWVESLHHFIDPGSKITYLYKLNGNVLLKNL